MMNELRIKLMMLEKMEEIANHAEADYEENPESAECEERFDQAYKNEFKYYMECAKLTQKISGGKIDFQTAKKLVMNDREQLLKIIDEYTLNSMCENCKRLGKDCEGTTKKLWSGCVYKEVA